MPVDAQLIMLKLEGAQSAAQTPFLTGKTFTVLKASGTAGGTGKWLFLQPVGNAAAAAKDIVVLKVQHGAGQLSWLVGKTFTMGKAPMMAGGGAAKFLVLHPSVGLAGTSVAGATVAAKGLTAAKTFAPTMKTAAFQTAGTASTGTTAMTVGKSAAAGTLAKSAAAAGTIWIGSGIGLGAGAASPLVFGALILATGVGIYQYRKKRAAIMRTDDEFCEAFL